MGRVQGFIAAVAALARGIHALDADISGGVHLRATEASSVPPQRTLRGQVGETTISEVETSLVSELAGNVSDSRLKELEVALRPMYNALPKEQSGFLSHQAVRYALHRLLLQRHGWFIVGLEPSDEALPPYLHKEWVPQYLQGILEQRLGDRGLDLHETAALAATLEDLVRTESGRRLDAVFKRFDLPSDARASSSEAEHLMETYMMMYLDGGNFTSSGADVNQELEAFKSQYTDWESAASWMREIKVQHISTTADGKVGRQELLGIANDLGERFSTFNDGECRSLKRELTSLEGPQPGRVPLLDFYKKGLHSHWEFNEKAEYLRVLGALDESDALHPSVITANYVGSRPNCLAASSLYAVCCRNECEDLMGSLERELAASSASPQDILGLVRHLSSDTVNASVRQLPDSLVQRLQAIAERHGGQVPLHGRLFAQWMHHAYPRECPYPHETGVNPQTPNEWLQGEGQEMGAKASEAEVRNLLGDCVGSDSAPCPRRAGAAPAAPSELPWTDSEVLLGRGLADDEVPALNAVLGKISLLVTLIVFVTFLSTKQGSSLFSMRDKPRAARYLDFADFDDLQDPKGAARRLKRLQQWVAIFAIIAIAATLEFMGWLDRFSCGCTLLGGLLVNGGLHVVRMVAPARSLKAGKHLA